jgi:hemerythrin-like domain-containing protein
MQDHKIILRCLDVLDDMAGKTANGEQVEHEDVKSILRFLRTFADDHHQTKEESALFPELMRTARDQERQLRQMLFEHDQERSLVEALEDALHTKRGQDFVCFGNRLSSLIRNHIYKEDNILFDLVERALSPDQDQKVAAELSQFQMDAGILDDLRQLECKYLSKAA